MSKKKSKVHKGDAAGELTQPAWVDGERRKAFTDDATVDQPSTGMPSPMANPSDAPALAYPGTVGAPAGAPSVDLSGSAVAHDMAATMARAAREASEILNGSGRAIIGPSDAERPESYKARLLHQVLVAMFIRGTNWGSELTMERILIGFGDPGDPGVSTPGD